MGFEDDFNRIFDELGISRTDLAERLDSSPAYVSKVLNGTAGNFQLSTMAKLARAIGAIVQIRLIIEGKEAVRVVDYETAGQLDTPHRSLATQTNVVNLESFKAGHPRHGEIGAKSQSVSDMLPKWAGESNG
jgi:transcriptional regulator with XRE-family HTH domain